MVPLVAIVKLGLQNQFLLVVCSGTLDVCLTIKLTFYLDFNRFFSVSCRLKFIYHHFLFGIRGPLKMLIVWFVTLYRNYKTPFS